MRNHLLPGSRSALPALVLAVLTLAASAEPFDGLTLVNPLASNTMRLITNDGRTVNTWHCGKPVSYMPYLMPDSTVWRPGLHPAPQLRPGACGGLIERYNWAGDVIQSFEWSGPDHIQHHDIQPLPNGNILVLSLDRYTRAEAEAMGRLDISTDHIWSEMIVEYDPFADSVVWEWRLWDHLVQDVDSTKPNHGVIAEHPHRLDINAGMIHSTGDWIHANAIDYCAEEDLVVFSSHRLHEFYIIDHSTTTEEARGSTGGRHGKGGDILYRWGNPQNYGRGTSADQRFFVVHGVNFIEAGLPGAGNILAFNNGDRPGTSNDYSSVEEIAPPRDSAGGFYIHPDSAFGPEEPVWMYSNPGTFYSNHLSGAFRMPNGNTFMIEGTKGYITEVDSTGTVVWNRPLGGQTGRAIKYHRDFSVGTREEPETRGPKPEWRLPTIVRGSLLLGAGHNPILTGESGLCPKPALLDISGRKVMELQSGENDVRHLRSGVYFARAVSGRVARVVLVD